MSSIRDIFLIGATSEAEQISQLLGMEPSWVHRKGEMLEGASAPAKGSTWDLHCRPGTGDSMEEQIRALLDVLTPKAEEMKSLASRFHADLNVAHSCGGGSTVLGLDREVLQRLAALNLNLNCFYISSENEDDN